MNYIIVWLTTVLISYIYDIKIAFRMFKDIADVGYKINVENFKDFANNMPTNSNSYSKIIKFIPFANLFYALYIINSYENNKQMIFTQFDSLGFLEEMSEEEKREYQKNPTGLNAVVITLGNDVTDKTQGTELPVGTIRISEPNGETSVVNIKFNLHSKENFIEIVSASGPVANLPLEEQKQFVLKHLNLAFEKYDAKKDQENLVKEDVAEEVKPMNRLERYKQLKESILQNGYLYGPEMVEYKELKEEFENRETLSLKK